ncbi:DUF7301 family protein [Serratia fonticola]
MTTVAELLQSDLKEALARRTQYWRSSSLPAMERFKHKPTPPKSPRDRVLKHIMRMNMLAVGRRFNLR